MIFSQRFTQKACKTAQPYVLELLPEAVYDEFVNKEYGKRLAPLQKTFFDKLPFDFTKKVDKDLLKLAHKCLGVKPQSLTETAVCLTESTLVSDPREEGIARFAVTLRAICSAAEWPSLKQHLDTLKAAKQLPVEVRNLLKKHSWEWFFVQMLYKATYNASDYEHKLMKAIRNYAAAVLKADASSDVSEKALAKLEDKALAAMVEMAGLIRAQPASGFILESSVASQELPLTPVLQPWVRIQALHTADDVIVDATFKLLALLDDLCPTQINSDMRANKVSKQLYQVLCFFKALMDVYVLIKDFPSELELQHLTSNFEWSVDADDENSYQCAELSRNTWRNCNFKKLRFNAKLKELTPSDVRQLLISTDTFKHIWIEPIDTAAADRVWMGHRRQKHLTA